MTLFFGMDPYFPLENISVDDVSETEEEEDKGYEEKSEFLERKRYEETETEFEKTFGFFLNFFFLFFSFFI